MRGAWYTHGDEEGAVGGGIFALRRPRPYSRALARISLRVALRFWNAKRNIHHDAARRVATVFEKWNCLIESCLPVERERPQKD